LICDYGLTFFTLLFGSWSDVFIKLCFTLDSTWIFLNPLIEWAFFNKGVTISFSFDSDLIGTYSISYFFLSTFSFFSYF
jgi:hypothetical protein